MLPVTWGVFLYATASDKNASLRQAQARAETTVQVFQENTERIFLDIDHTLLMSRLAFETDRDHFDLKHWAASASLISGGTIQIALIGADGYLLTTTARYEGPRLFLGDREHFIKVAQLEDDSFYIAKPVLGRASGKWSIQTARKLRNKDGSFGGIIVGSIDPDAIGRSLDMAELGPQGNAVLRNANDVILAARGISSVPGQIATSQQLHDALQRSDKGFYWNNAIDGVNRLVAYRKSQILPLIFAIGISEDQIYAGYRANLLPRGSALVALTIILVFAAGLDLRRRQRLEQAHAELAQVTRRLTRANEQFDAAVSNMPNGLCMFDAQSRLMFSNREFREMYRLRDDQVIPGTPLAKILQAHLANGENAEGGIEGFTEAIATQALQTHVLADGRTVVIRRKRLADGGWVATHEDISDRARNENRVAYLAEHDLLTGLANRSLLARKMEEIAKRSQRQGTSFSVLMLDLDRFKQVNDTLGHSAGDQLLVQVTDRLTRSVRDTDVLARQGGDEFVIVQENEKDQHDGALQLARRIIGIIGAPFDIAGQQVNVGTSIGIAYAPEQGTSSEELLKKADLALYQAKASGRNVAREFRADMIAAAEAQKLVESELRRAISEGQLELHYQPVVTVNDRHLAGVEALVRWRHPSRGLILPDQFIPLAESSGLIVPLGDWVLRRAFKDAAHWPTGVKVAVNVSARQFSADDLFDRIMGCLVESGVSPNRIELEVTETVLLEKRPEHLRTIRQLKNLGISIALDDFGIGFSSANYLAQFPFDKIKIDKSLTHGAIRSRESAAVIASALALARGLGIVTTAEGVETEEQFAWMRDAGANLAQGHLFGEPAPLQRADDQRTAPRRRTAV